MKRNWKIDLLCVLALILMMVVAYRVLFAAAEAKERLPIEDAIHSPIPELPAEESDRLGVTGHGTEELLCVRMDDRESGWAAGENGQEAQGQEQPETAKKAERWIVRDGSRKEIAPPLPSPEPPTARPDTRRIPYTEEDLAIIVNVVLHEAGSCTDRHQQLVACVVINRVLDARWPDTVKGVVEQPRQYSASYTRNLPDIDSEDADISKAVRNAKAALDGETECPEDVCYQAEFYQGKGVYETIRSSWGSVTYFCYA